MSSRFGRTSVSPYADDDAAYTRRRTPASRAATRTASVASTLARCDVSGSATDRGTDGIAAWCRTTSTPATAVAGERDIGQVAGQHLGAAVEHGEVGRLAGAEVVGDAHRLRRDRAASAARCEPMNPAPPVTSQRAMVSATPSATARRRAESPRARQAWHESQRVAVVQLPAARRRAGPGRTASRRRGSRGSSRSTRPRSRTSARSTGTRWATYESLPNRMRSWYLTKKARAARGCRPSSARIAPVSVTTFGCSSSSAPEARQVVGVIREVRGDERRLRMAREQAIPLGHERLERRELAGRAPALRDGPAARASARWSRSTGSKNGAGSAVWISTGTP